MNPNVGASSSASANSQAAWRRPTSERSLLRSQHLSDEVAGSLVTLRTRFVRLRISRLISSIAWQAVAPRKKDIGGMHTCQV